MRWLPTLAIAAACGSAPRSPPAPRAPVAAGPWTWTASAGGPWRLPAPAVEVAIAPGDAHAVVRIGAHDAVAIDLASGAVGPVTALVAAPAVIESLTRVGDRLIAFGTTDAGPAAWAIAPAPLAATPLALPDPEPAKPSRSPTGAVAVSPDGSRLIVCSRGRWPVVRDAVTLAAIRVFDTIQACREPGFTDADHVVLRWGTSVILDVRTGVVSQGPARGPSTYAGPGGRMLTATDATWRFTDATGAVTAEVRGHGIPRWAPDGSAVVSLGAGPLYIQPAAGGEARKIALPIGEGAPRLAMTATGTAVVAAGYFVIAVDLAAGTLRTAGGNVGTIAQVAPRAGTVIVASDRIRAWRDGRLVANGETGVVGFTADPPTAPVVTISFAAVSAWDPATGDRRIIKELEDTATRVARAGDRIVFDDGHALFRSRRGRPPSPWFRFHDDLTLTALDVHAGRVAWWRDDAYVVAEIGRGQAWAFCASGTGLVLDPGRPRAAVDDAGEVQLYDLRDRRALDRLAFDDLEVGALAFDGATGRLVIAGLGEVVVWDPATRTAVGWKTAVPGVPLQLGIDATGSELAIGYPDGTVVWATLSGLRAHAVPRPVALRPPSSLDCADLPLAQPALDELTVGGDDDARDNPECNDTNDDPDDDCSLIYGTPD